MTPALILSISGAYFALLLAVSFFTSRHADNDAFFRGEKKSPWFAVAFGMIGASLSGVTFISVPGWVGSTHFTYMQMVLGYMAGYLVIALVLLPLYYSFNLTSIYRYLNDRFDVYAYKTGAGFFLLSRTIGAAFRLFLVAGVLHMFVFGVWGVPFWLTVTITITLIWLYTFRGGIKTIVWTDTLQTFFMLLAAILTAVLISRELGLGISDLPRTISASGYAEMFVFDGNNRNFFIQFMNGAFIALVMTGLDQDMMQKNLSIRTLKQAQRNIYAQMPMFIMVNILFLSLGALLYIFAISKYNELSGSSLPIEGQYPNEALLYLADKAGVANYTSGAQFPPDGLFPLLALKYLNPVVGVAFVVGLIAAAYSSADSALTALTTSFCVDFLGMKENDHKVKTRILVHLAFSIALLGVIIIFSKIADRSVIDRVFMAAGYTYGPLLGLFSFGILTKRKAGGWPILFVALLSPVLTYIIKSNEALITGDYVIGHEVLLINGLITFTGLYLISKKKDNGRAQSFVG